MKGRTVLSMESTLARMNRLGRSVLIGVPLLSLDEIVARDRRGHARRRRGARAPSCSCPSGCRAAGVGGDEDTFRAALEPVSRQRCWPHNAA